MVKRIEGNKGFLVDGKPMQITPSDPSEANALAIITHPADAQSIAEAESFVARAMKEDAATGQQALLEKLIAKGKGGAW